MSVEIASPKEFITGTYEVNGKHQQVDEEPSKVNILMVDDTPENLIALEAVLTDLNQNLIKANSGDEALRLLLKQEVAVILLDVNMPGMNGFETAAMIRQRKSSEHTPIIFVSAISTTETHMYKGYALGAVDYIFTPVMPDVLRTKVAVFVELVKKTDEMRRQSERLREIEEREHKRKLLEATERLELQTKRNRFFTLSIELLAIAGYDGNFKQLNPTWQKTLGYDEDELRANPLIQFVHPDDQKKTLEDLSAAKKSGQAAYFENRLRCKTGGFRWLGWTVAPFKDEELLYLFARDITEKRHAEDEIRKLNQDLAQRASQLQTSNSELQNEIAVRKKTEEALQESNSALESFSYSVSHDLRAPLRAMQGFARVLLEDYGEQLDETGRDYAQRILSGADRMDHLIQDLLIYSRLGHAELELKGCDLEAAMEEVLSQLQSEIRDNQAEIQIKKPLHPVRGHPATIGQILCNLLSNGIKFMPPGTKPVLQVYSENRDGMVRICVKDNGIGIAPEHHARIFRVFERLHGTETYPGTGIGLAIVRKGCERMGGNAGLESKPGAGSCFWIELPRFQKKA